MEMQASESSQSVRLTGRALFRQLAQERPKPAFESTVDVRTVDDSKGSAHVGSLFYQ